MIEMWCQIGGFTWNLESDGYCPNHGSYDRWGNKRDRSYALSGEDGPYDVRNQEPYLDCCSVSEWPKIDEEEWVKDFVEKLKLNRPIDKTDEDLEKFARDMFQMAQERGRAMSEIDTEDDGDTGATA